MDEKTICIIALILAFLFFLGYFIYQLKKNGLRGTTIKLIVYAEKLFKKGENRDKMNYVIDKVIALLPMPVRFFITRDGIEKFIQLIFDEIKEALDYNSTGGQV